MLTGLEKINFNEITRLIELLRKVESIFISQSAVTIIDNAAVITLDVGRTNLCTDEPLEVAVAALKSFYLGIEYIRNI